MDYAAIKNIIEIVRKILRKENELWKQALIPDT